MKRIIVVLVLVVGLAVVAFASLSNSTRKADKQQVKKDLKKKHCSHTCPYSS